MTNLYRSLSLAAAALCYARDMSEAHAFDTHAAVKTLTEAGAETRLAEAFVSVARDARDRGDLVTAADLKAALADLRTEVVREMNAQTWRLIGAGIAIAGLAVGALRLLA